jgi:hypothetical protein
MRTGEDVPNKALQWTRASRATELNTLATRCSSYFSHSCHNRVDKPEYHIYVSYHDNI